MSSECSDFSNGIQYEIENESQENRNYESTDSDTDAGNDTGKDPIRELLRQDDC